VYRLGDALRHHIVHPFLDRNVAPQSEEIADGADDRRIAQPRDVLSHPDVMMGVDDRTSVADHDDSKPRRKTDWDRI
jgi:hypothetical protein